MSIRRNRREQGVSLAVAMFYIAIVTALIASATSLVLSWFMKTVDASFPESGPAAWFLSRWMHWLMRASST